MKANKQLKIIFVVVAALVFGVSGYGQKSVKGVTNGSPYFEEKLNSKLMGRDMPYRIIVPGVANIDAASKVRYPVIYLLHGLYGHYSNWTDKTKLTEYFRSYKFIIVMPEGGNGWYSDSATAAADKYESYIVKELIPEIDAKYPTIVDREHRIIAGLSMGGYGSIKFGIKYPSMFSLVGSFSGAVNAAAFNEKNAGAIGKTVDAAFGADDGPARRSNDIFEMLKTISPDAVKGLPYVYLSCGTDDFLFQSNRDLDQIIIEKKITHEYREHPGAHTWEFWDDQIREFLAVADRSIKK